MEKRFITFLVVTIVLTALVLFLTRTKNGTGKRTRVYGSMACGWTRKQLEDLGDNGEFIDCTVGQCPEFVTGYPTVQKPDGTISVGYSKA
jgi:hypothetical protein